MNNILFSAIRSFITQLAEALTSRTAKSESTPEPQPVAGCQTFSFFDSQNIVL